ncbi:DUF3667 domain-containing protein [Winogradskyella haliclonae]|uniref:DUF3667 domain-containing protein n=1 Tax=Winogradskyella haliclonae TaxID=2048558 RepID=A0ABQ2BTG4_9FLAO|nr:DUF3667 domain-containing protein [Winogradskyella haliclonae]GGI55740.1 hypothetical protein GCM10011444_00490 [Winogradskyella haliclonae]
MNCKNCGHSINQNFCSYCGQRTAVSSINFRTLINEFQNTIFQINRGFLFTIKELAVRPGHAIRDFINGKRKPYYKPISFLLVVTTIYIFVSYLLDVDSFLANFLNNFKEGFDNANQENSKLKLSDNGIIDWLKTNQTYLVFVFVPIFSIASFIAFFKAKYNFYEHLVLQLYVTGQQFVMITVFTCIFFFNSEILMLATLASSVLYSLFVYWQFFKGKSFINIFFRYILIQVLFFLFYFVISLITIFIGVIISKLL